MKRIFLAPLLLVATTGFAQIDEIVSPRQNRVGVEYVSTATDSILDRAANEIRSAGNGSLVAVVAPYILHKNFADAMCEARRKGANVVYLAQANPGIKNYTGLDYLARNRVVIYTEDIPASHECFVINTATGVTLVLNIPPDPDLESALASMLVFHSSDDVRKTLTEVFAKRVNEAAQYKDTAKNLEKTQP